MENIVHILRRRSMDTPQKLAYRFFRGGTQPVESLTFSQVWSMSTSLAFELAKHNLQGKRVLVTCGSQTKFIIGFFACLLLGAIAVPSSLPRRRYQDRFTGIVKNSAADAILLDDDLTKSPSLSIQLNYISFLDLRDYSYTSIPGRADDFMDNISNHSQLAFIQYTSGSTDDPSGVMVTHSNIIDNCCSIKSAMGYTESSEMFSALPLFHDMGLIGSIVLPVYVGCTSSHMSPAEFVQYPERFLQIISRYKITHCGGPNYIYNLAVESIDREKIGQIDLSAWKVAFCGAEPISVETYERFSRVFQEYGFRKENFFPCYGLAEATLFVTGKKLWTSPTIDSDLGGSFVCCGVPAGDTKVIIVDAKKSEQLEDGSVGEIWVSGSSVADGYWNHPEKTKLNFYAILKSEDNSVFLRTGDLGYIKNHELYVTGRSKDVIFFNGRNLWPQDIERSAESSHDALKSGGSAAFWADGESTAGLVIVAEIRREHVRDHDLQDIIVSTICRAISNAHGISPKDVILIKPGELPRTSSGKVKRGECKERYHLKSFFD
jgi:acyl-CoA synthetase (AMP-forming)/AMP-acid ligase II